VTLFLTYLNRYLKFRKDLDLELGGFIEVVTFSQTSINSFWILLQTEPWLLIQLH